MPPKLQAIANPSKRHLENFEFEGKSRTTGVMKELMRMGAVVLLIQVDRNNPSIITARMNNLGRWPSLRCIQDASRSSS